LVEKTEEKFRRPDLQEKIKPPKCGKSIRKKREYNFNVFPPSNLKKIRPFCVEGKRTYSCRREEDNNSQNLGEE